ncbi:MAG TPA: ABC transporter ATP-binding protein [Rheinheimera sp.]|uniref:ABC transporter ATP-binding protein n=1 Tax=Rheinheimera sp. TaxID=1869214 RepID=UPI000EE5F4F4|nr:ABC transporter ATP-binding protein [Rheinheimera sp.]HCU64394.1 ABC transporter ATP-binding protein [Rheinheimera sp.]
MQDVLIQTDRLTKSFKSAGAPMDALKGVSLTVTRGEFLAIEGPSGCGKSTLLSILGLLDLPTGGSYELCGQKVSSLSRYQQSVLRNRHIGWIFQNFNLIGDMTVLENLILPLRYDNSVKKSTYQSKALSVIERMGLTDKAMQYPGQLSGGQQQRVAIARALVMEPDLLLADEPTGNLDSENAERVFNLLAELNSQGATIIMVTHAPELARRCKRVVTMLDGLVVEKCNPSR